jgi:hypothetical protein
MLAYKMDAFPCRDLMLPHGRACLYGGRPAMSHSTPLLPTCSASSYAPASCHQDIGDTAVTDHSRW